MHQNNTNNELHVPVLLDDVLRYLNPQTGESYLDLTAGYGGHASKVMERTKNPGGMVLVDRDIHAVDVLKQTFQTHHAEILEQDFYEASQQLSGQGRQFDMILADLGVSSPHLNDAVRGFSISHDGPLDMRMDQRQSLTATTIVNTWSEVEIADILRAYGEEPKAKAIARLIVHNRPFTVTSELAAIAKKAWPGHSTVHPATRTFQAFRIAVNDELGLLERSLPLWFMMLKPGGRIVIISFHSLEDRIVKQAFKDRAGNRFDAELTELTKRPVTASHDEVVFNPRARSAKLRAAVKK